MKPRPNIGAGVAATVWLIIIAVPLLVMFSATFQTRGALSENGLLSLPTTFTFDHYLAALSFGFVQQLGNTIIVTACVVGLVLVLVPALSFAIVRSTSKTVSLVFRIFLLGLAIPAQAVIIPIFYMISSMGLYDNLIGVILPTAAFALPLCTLIITGSMRDITSDLYEAMALDGAGAIKTFVRLVLPLSKGGIATAAIFAALQAWNGFLFPLILTQSEATRVIPLGLFHFQTQFGINVPGMLAAVTLSMLPLLLVYLFARRALVQGVMGMGGK